LACSNFALDEVRTDSDRESEFLRGEEAAAGV